MPGPPLPSRPPALLALLAVLVLVAGCREEDMPEALAPMHPVEVWFSRGEEPVSAQRRVSGAPLDGALRALVLGPTPEERADGLGSWFSLETRGVLRRVRAEDGEVEVDFRDLPDLIPGASSSAGSQQLLASLNRTVFQFDWVESVEYRLDGSCDAFWEWLQRSCQVVAREDVSP
jgi:hypothetical protein